MIHSDRAYQDGVDGRETLPYRRGDAPDLRSCRVPTYGYDCTDCGAFDLVRPMAEVSAPAPCPGCGAHGRRLFGAPALRSLDPALTGAIDASARTAEAPGVVDRLPASRRRTRYTADPRHLRLPRP